VGGGDEARVVIRQDGLGLGLGDLEQDLLEALGERRVEALGDRDGVVGERSDCQTILVASLPSLPDSIMALRLRSKSVAQSTWPLATAISLAAWVAPSE
jgi:hypothetical protein